MVGSPLTLPNIIPHPERTGVNMSLSLAGGTLQGVLHMGSHVSPAGVTYCNYSVTLVGPVGSRLLWSSSHPFQGQPFLLRGHQAGEVFDDDRLL